jgi:hypothetical protein
VFCLLACLEYPFSYIFVCSICLLYLAFVINDKLIDNGKVAFNQCREIGLTFLTYQSTQLGGLPNTKDELKRCYEAFCALTPGTEHHYAKYTTHQTPRITHHDTTHRLHPHASHHAPHRTTLSYLLRCRVSFLSEFVCCP